MIAFDGADVAQWAKPLTGDLKVAGSITTTDTIVSLSKALNPIAPGVVPVKCTVSRFR